MFPTEDTIAAIASAPGHAQRGIIRLSGPHVATGLTRIIADIESTLDTIQQATVLSIEILPMDGFPAVQASLYYWPDRRSYTQQCSAELHLPGALAYMQAVLSSLCHSDQNTESLRIAQPGEFTLRAFLAGRIDLIQAEAVLGVIDARDQKELALALSQLAGGLNSQFQTLRDQLLHMLAHLEAGLDFAEEDIEFIGRREMHQQVIAVHTELLKIRAQLHRQLDQATKYRVVLRGQANAGKSSLFNALARQPVALVSDVAGTTRDYVSQPLELGNLNCLLIDTAGTEAADELHGNEIQQHAQAMTDQQQRHAQLEIFCIDGTTPLSKWENEQLQYQPDHARIVVSTKSDKPKFKICEWSDICTAVTTDQTVGVDRLEELVAQRLNQQAGEAVVLQQTAARCQESLSRALESIERVLQICQQSQGDELLAAELHSALQHLGMIVGAVYNDDVLDRIFSTFCIGK